MPLQIYRDTAFVPAYNLVQIDVFVGDGFTTVFTLVNKTGLQCATSVWVGGAILTTSNLDFMVSGNTVIFTVPPANGVNIVIPGMNAEIMTAYDQLGVGGNVFSNIIQVPFYLVDANNIGLYSYSAYPGLSGIQLLFVNNDPGNGANADWFSLASANADGSPGAFNAAGDPLVTTDISSATQFQLSSIYLATDIFVDDPTDFLAGDIITIGAGTPNQEIVQVTAISGNDLTISGAQFGHNAGDPIFTSGRKFWGQCEIPVNYTDDNFAQYLNVSLQYLANEDSRF